MAPGLERALTRRVYFRKSVHPKCLPSGFAGSPCPLGDAQGQDPHKDSVQGRRAPGEAFSLLIHVLSPTQQSREV